jgi:hypothetical protein
MRFEPAPLIGTCLATWKDRSVPDMILAELSAALGEKLTFDATGQCALGFDGNVEVVLARASTADALTLRSEIVRVAPHDASRLRTALAVNYGDLPPGMCIAFDAVSEQLMLFCIVPLDALEGDDLLALVGRFVELTPVIRSRFAPTGGDAMSGPHAASGGVIRG